MNKQSRPYPIPLSQKLHEKRWINPYVHRISEYPEVVLHGGPDDRAQRLEFFRARTQSYGRLIIELCSGSGGHLVTLAERNSDALCVGFELRYKRVVRTAEKAIEAGLSNVIMVHDSAQNLLEYTGPESIDQLHINFPDPWSKARWVKHRVLSDSMLIDISTALKVNGTFNYKTDHSERFAEVQCLLKNVNSLNVAHVTDDLRASAADAENIPTEFERLFVSQGKTIFYLQAFRA